MLRVIRNHRRAAYGESELRRLSVQPVALDAKMVPSDLLGAAQRARDKALELGQAQVTETPRLRSWRLRGLSARDGL